MFIDLAEDFDKVDRKILFKKWKYMVLVELH